MKNGIVLTLIGVAIGFGCAKALDQPAVADSAQEMVDQLKPGAVFGLMHIEVEEGVDMNELQNYLATETIPHLNRAWEKTGSGIKNYLVQGERGAKEGMYGVLFYFPDLDARNRFFPTEGPRDEYDKMVAEGEFPPPFEETIEGYQGVIHLGDHIILPSE